MSESRMIVVKKPFEDAQSTGEAPYWAVKPPAEKWVYKDTGVTHEFGGGYRLFGSNDVVIADEDDLEGVRELLDRIEEDMRGEDAPDEDVLQTE